MNPSDHISKKVDAVVKLTNIRPHIDPEITVLYNKPVLDILQFDSDLTKRFDDYDVEIESMKSFIERMWGKEGVETIRYAFDLETESM
ncbi:hypothetical protein KMW28_27110 [Flammeovirga yaeyamensis]|uniref:Uncharacterized protein n=1 Tax=Flammeovirga yaeyamensis TaxID=367791 RepID=A0AAX1NAU2_9BACT|nr:hypothetical protein [Flammeovirga yaeyamensis]MBB3700051.1 hypothetical protein [Flammeovirga yaeyamensis]NMF37513.1 hypothetical protein [Flammeovirga yaeyamensis]QWG04570.1 hypothetical protein KMW28_27110 [Flammeovirga yaeyamensis]